MLRRFVVGCFGLIVVASALLVYVMSTSSGDSASAAKANAVVASSEDSNRLLADLKSRIKQIERRQGGQVATQLIQKDSNENQHESAEQRRQKRDDRPAQEKAWFKDYFTALDHVRAREGHDPPWEAMIATKAFKEAGASQPEAGQLKVDDVQCGARLCRIELSYDAAAAPFAQRSLMSWRARLGPDLPKASLFHDKEGLRATAYFSRKGPLHPQM
jgi:hypothetical protein